MKVYSYIPSYTVPVSAIIGIYLYGFWTFITPIYIFLLLPLAEWFAGENRYNLNSQEEERTKSSLGYSFLFWSHVPIQYFVTGYFLWICSTGHLTGWSLAGGILSVGISNGGVRITVANELIHRSSRFEQWLGRAILLTTFYMHFAIEQVYGHHKHVATPEDPATAKKGEHFYRFWLRTVPGQYFSAWKIERKRLEKFRHSFFSTHNEMLLFFNSSNWFFNPDCRCIQWNCDFSFYGELHHCFQPFGSC